MPATTARSYHGFIQGNIRAGSGIWETKKNKEDFRSAIREMKIIKNENVLFVLKLMFQLRVIILSIIYTY